jgi:hypothetical protein
MRRNLWLLGLALAALAAGCSKAERIAAPTSAFSSGGASFTTYVAMGTSISAGTQSDGLVVTHQQKAFPYLFAQQARVASFTIPSVSHNGIPALLQIRGLTPLGGVIINRTGIAEGAELNRTQATAFHNMGVPFSVLPDVADTSLYYLERFPGDARPRMFNIVARHRGSILQQVAGLAPTFITFEYGSNEILGAAGSGSGTPIVPAALWAGALNATLNALQAAAPGAKLALVNVPDPTTTPLVTTFKPVTRNASGQIVPLIGPGGTPLTLGDFVLLTAGDSLAAGTGFPVGTTSYLSGVPGNGRPLLDSHVLSAAEVASLRNAQGQYNAAVQAEANARGAAYVDLAGLLRTANTTGFPFQTQVLTSAFVTGGLFSLDGVHPTDVAQGILCNALIDAVNARYGANVPHLDLASVASRSSSSAVPATREGPLFPVYEDSESLLRSMFPWRP